MGMWLGRSKMPKIVRISICVMLFAGLPPLLAAAQVQRTGDYLSRMDKDGDGKVSLSEYLDWMGYAFERMDRNGDGVLTADELPGGKGPPVSREAHRAQLAERFRKQDLNHDGTLSAKELAAPPQ